MAYVFVDRARMTSATAGTGALTLGSAIPGFRSFADAGVGNGDTFPYVIEDGSSWEIGTGTLSGSTVARSLISSSTGSLLNLSGDAVIYISPLAADAFSPAERAAVETIAGKADGSDVTAALAASKQYVDDARGMDLLGVISTASGAAASLTGIAAGDFRCFYVEIDGLTFASAAALRMASSINNGSSYGADVAIGQAFAAGADGGGSGILYGVSDGSPQAREWDGYVSPSGSPRTWIEAGVAAPSGGDINALRFSPSAGNFTGGAITVYGLK